MFYLILKTKYTKYKNLANAQKYKRKYVSFTMSWISLLRGGVWIIQGTVANRVYDPKVLVTVNKE